MTLRDQALDLQVERTDTVTHYEVTDGPIAETWRGRRMRVTSATVTTYADSEEIDVRLDGYLINTDGSRDRRNTTGETAGHNPELQQAFAARHLIETGVIAR